MSQERVRVNQSAVGLRHDPICPDADETLDKTGGRFGLCQWEDEDREGRYLGPECTRRTDDVYCARHNRQLDRESERRRREKERTSTSTPTPSIREE